MNRARKEKLREQIERLEPQEHAQLFGIIKRYTDSYTQTQSGVLVSSDVLSNDCLLEIEKMVHFYLDQRKRMEVDTAARKAYKNGQT